MRKLKGYIFSRPFMNERAPQHVQNIVIRNFCEKNNFLYQLSATEYTMQNSYAVLRSLINKKEDYSGIIAYSIYQLPDELNLRIKLLKQILKNKKFFVSAVEGIYIKSSLDICELNKCWNIAKLLESCPKKIFN